MLTWSYQRGATHNVLQECNLRTDLKKDVLTCVWKL